MTHKTALLFITALSLPAFAITGKSSASYKTKGESFELKTSNTEFRYLMSPRQVGEKFWYEPTLFEIKSEMAVKDNLDAAETDLTFTARDPKTNKKLWSAKERADKLISWDSYYAVMTVYGGSCASTYHMYNSKTGTPLMRFSAQNPDGLPIIMRGGAFDPEAFRFLSYQDSTWACRGQVWKKEAPAGLKFAGLISFSSSDRPLQKIAVYYDPVKAADPSHDPDFIELVHMGKTVKFGDPKNPGPREYEYWFREDKSETKFEGNRSFSGITVNLRFDKDVISIPLEDGKLMTEKATTGEIYSKVIEVPESEWKGL